MALRGAAPGMGGLGPVMTINRLVSAASSLAFAAVVALGASSAQAQQTTYPLTIDNCGFDLTFDGPPERVVVYSLAVHNLLALGLEDRILSGISLQYGDELGVPWEAAHAEVPSQGVQAMSGGLISEEALLALEPDFVYSPFFYYLNTDETANRTTLMDFGIPAFLSPVECRGQATASDGPITFDTLFEELRTLATIFDIRETADPLIADWEARVAAVTESAADFSDVSILWWYAGTDSPYVAGCCGTPGMIGAAIGAQNTYNDDPSVWPAGIWEVIADRDPDVIVLADLNRSDLGASAEEKIEFLRNDPVTSVMSAVQNDRYIILPGSHLDTSILNVYTLEHVIDGLVELGFGGQ